jgi:NADPH2:quinone reductase
MGMRAILVERFGGPEELTAAEVPDPAAGPGQAVIGVAVADTLFVETQIRAGLARAWFTTQPPYVPGRGVAGEVIAVGEGVDPSWTGRRVVAHVDGAYAERVAVPVHDLVPIPDGLNERVAVALLHDGITALRLMETTGVKPGERVLVTAAGGGMGILLVQLAHAAGARVVAAARGRAKLDLVREQGADVTVDYSAPDWTEQVGGEGFDVVFDGAGGEIGRAAFGVTVDGGRFSAHGAPAGGFAVPAEDERRGVTVRGIQALQLDPETARRLITEVLAEAAAGRLRPVIGQTFPLVQAADAHAAIEARAVVGKTLLVI